VSFFKTLIFSSVFSRPQETFSTTIDSDGPEACDVWLCVNSAIDYLPGVVKVTV
jgi:hypothetical protein